MCLAVVPLPTVMVMMVQQQAGDRCCLLGQAR